MTTNQSPNNSSNPTIDIDVQSTEQLEPKNVLFKKEQLVFDLGHIPSLKEADFIVSEGNELAYGHICSFPNWAGPLALIIGPAKAGKTHLGMIWQERAQAQLVTADNIKQFTGDGGMQPVLIDDADRARFDEAELFHLLNRSMRDGRPVLMTARLAPEHWNLATNDVLSRVRLASQFHVEPADDIQLSHMFVKLFEDRQIAVDPKIITYLVLRMERSPQEAVALVSIMDKLALTRRTGISRTIAAEAIEIRRSNAGGVDVSGVTKEVLKDVHEL